ncbi:MAG: FKBP-type peptidyl-prolyl cis-trans isomerase [Thermoanaerobaculaceae bacterium]
MRHAVTVGLLVAVCGTAVLAQEPVQTLASQKDKISYAIGVDIGNSFKRQGVEVDVEILAKGLRDSLAGGKVLLAEKEVREVIQAYQTELRAKAQEKAKQDGAAFLAENGKKPGVTTLSSGLQYKVITAGTGPKPTADDSVKCHYRGTLIDGKEFDSSYSRNQPAVFPVRGVIAGWTEALQLMPVGSKWQLVVPFELGYGAGGNRGIPPYSTLVFEVELLGIEPPAATEAPRAEPPHQH